jgi:RNA polymerase sigma-70 factor (ECF subfamily)
VSDFTENSSDPLTQTLVQRLRAGDGAAGETLENLHRDRLMRFAGRYLRNVHDAEDAVQEAFARIVTSDVEPRDFRVWSYRITRNVCLNQVRANGARLDKGRLSTFFDAKAEQTGALTRLVRAEDGAALGDLLARLSESQCEVLTLRYLEGLEREEIAAVLELPVSVVKSRLYEGVSRLRQLATE